MDRKKFLGIITGDVVTSGEDTTVSQIAHMMKESNIGVVVILRGDVIVGMINERDIIRKVLAADRLPDEVLVKEVMCKDIVTVEIKDGLNNIYKTLCETKFRHLLVLDKGKLVGITSRRDLLDVLLSKRV